MLVGGWPIVSYPAKRSCGHGGCGRLEWLEYSLTAWVQRSGKRFVWPICILWVERRLMCGHATTSKLLALSHHGRGPWAVAVGVTHGAGWWWCALENKDKVWSWPIGKRCGWHMLAWYNLNGRHIRRFRCKWGTSGSRAEWWSQVSMGPTWHWHGSKRFKRFRSMHILWMESVNRIRARSYAETWLRFNHHPRDPCRAATDCLAWWLAKHYASLTPAYEAHDL